MAYDITSTKSLTKQCLGIISSATGKDNEIENLIYTAIADMTRLGITVDLTNAMHQTAIVQFVKGHFGMLDINTKNQCLTSYNLLISSLQMINYDDDDEA